MSLEAFVRSAGTVMGLARESFGAGGVALAPAPVGAGPGSPLGASGQAVDGSVVDSGRVGSDVAALGEHDQLGGEQLSDAVAAAGAGRTRMDAVIAAATADVTALGMSTDTPQGQKALVEAIKRHLQDTKTTLDQADNDAGTRAAAANTTAAGYNGIGMQTTPAVMMPGTSMGARGSGMSMMPSLPTGGLPLGSLASLAGMAQGLLATRPVATGAPDDVTGGAAPTAPSDNHVHVAPLLHNDKRSIARYTYQSARAHGYSPHDSLAITAYADGESGFDPTISGGPQGGSGEENTVIGEFQEKPQFARDGGVDPAQRYTVEGNTAAYLNNLAGNRGAGDIFDQLLATSKGGPMATGGRAKMAELMEETRQLIGVDA
jgi:hypothetical protein